jgi:4-amino-4-deoxy-L-arabinose transferase-like glycosyltransferase
MSSRRLWLAVLVTAAVVRLLALAAYPLHDTTEARYAEVARLMVVSGDWVTLQIAPGVPFWGKPPLSTWLTAASFELFGFNEFAARLPAFLLTLLTLVIVFRVGRKLYSAEAALAASAILFTSIVGFIASGAVMTDAALLLATTIALASFCMATCELRPFGGYGLFVGLGLGLLAKGPIALVLVGLPIFVWTLWQKNLLWLWRAFPWVTGSFMVLAIAGPWYFLAESRTPGFLEYFLVGEHWLRFVESGWQGDLYGTAHSRPLGTIWLYGLAAALPWSMVAIYAAVRASKHGSILSALTPTQLFLLLWMLTPLAFFTFAGNILPAYVLPGLPAFALLLGHWVSNRTPSLAYTSLIVPGLIAVASMSGFFASMADRSQQDLVDYHYKNEPASTLYYFPVLPHSASFYSHGRAQALRTDAELAEYLLLKDDGLVAIRSKDANKLAPDLAPCVQMEAVVHNYVLFRPRTDCIYSENFANAADR